MLVAEELECDWSKVRAEYADVNEHVRRNRIFGSMSTGGSRGIRDSQEYVRKARRGRARDAGCRSGAGMGRAGSRVQRERRASSRTQPSNRTHDVRQGGRGSLQTGSAEGAQAQGPEGVEADRHLAGALRHPRQDHRQADLCGRRAPARTGARVDRAVPGVRRQAEELRRLQDQGHARREESRERRRLGRGRRGQLVACQSGAQGSCRSNGMWARTATCRASRSCSSCAPGSKRRKRPSRARTAISTRRIARRRESDRSRVLRAVPEPRDHGAADRDGAGQGRQAWRCGSARRTARATIAAASESGRRSARET